MTPADAAMTLGVAASFDRRTVGEADAQAWAAALPDVGFGEARDAIVAHYRDETRWVMPADILRRVRAARRNALTGAPPAVPPAELADHPRHEQAWRRAYVQAVGGGQNPDQAYRSASAAVGIQHQDRQVTRRPGFAAALNATAKTMQERDA